MPDWDKIKANREALNNCKKHKFEWQDLEPSTRLLCVHCGGFMPAVHAMEYTLGYEAAGGNPNDIIEGFR